MFTPGKPGRGPSGYEDPIGLEGGINLHVYAGNDPVNNADPFGLQCVITYRYRYYKDTGEVIRGSVHIIGYSADCYGSGSSEGGGGGRRGRDKPPTECQILAKVGELIGSNSNSAFNFTTSFAEAAGGIRPGPSGLIDLRRAGRDLVPEGSGGGYLPKYGGNDTGQARHFAGAIAGAQRLQFGALFSAVSRFREPRNTQGLIDHQLSLAGLDFVRGLQDGSISPGNAGKYIHNNLCR